MGVSAEPNAGPPIEPGWRYVNVFRSYAPGMRSCTCVAFLKPSVLMANSRPSVEALVRADRWKGLGEGSELRKATQIQCTGILDIAMFTCGQFRRVQDKYDGCEA